MPRFELDQKFLAKTLVDLLNTPSPTGDTEYAVSLVEGECGSLGVPTRITRRGSLVAQMEGISQAKTRALTAHLDTLGAIVVEIKSNGRLRLKALNGLVWPTVESEGVTVRTRSGRLVRGSVVLVNGAAHVNKDAQSAVRNDQNLEVRIDERTTTSEETRLLGIEVGDYVAFDPKVEESESGFIRSRFLDDKACVACALAAIKILTDGDLKPAYNTEIIFSNHEEVGHGGVDGIPQELDELVVLDMGCIGTGLQGDEFHCSIGIADGGGPYSKTLTEYLRDLAENRGIDLKPDYYPFYSSDGTAYSRAGGHAQIALIGPGIDTSHGYERTHVEALYDTAQLIAEYLLAE